MFQWFIDRCAARMKLTTSFLHSISHCKRGTTEKRVLEAMLHSSFTREKLLVLRKEHVSVFKLIDSEANSEVEKAGAAGQQGTVGSSGTATVGNNNQSMIHGADEDHGNNESDDEILDVPESDDEDSDEDVDDRHVMEESDEDNCGLVRDIFRTRRERRNKNVEESDGSRHLEERFQKPTELASGSESNYRTENMQQLLENNGCTEVGRHVLEKSCEIIDVQRNGVQPFNFHGREMEDGSSLNNSNKGSNNGSDENPVLQTQ